MFIYTQTKKQTKKKTLVLILGHATPRKNISREDRSTSIQATMRPSIDTNLNTLDLTSDRAYKKGDLID